MFIVDTYDMKQGSMPSMCYQYVASRCHILIACGLYTSPHFFLPGTPDKEECNDQ